MAESKVRDENYYTVHGWMIRRLKLKGVQLSVYAIIYGFTQDGECEFKGSLQYLCDFTGDTSKPTIIKALKDLIDKGYIERTEEIINGVKFPHYKAVLPIPEPQNDTQKEILPPVKKFNGGSKEILPPPGKKILPNNNSIDIYTDIDRDKEIPSPEKILELFNTICKSLPPAKYLTSSRRESIESATSKYTADQIEECFRLAEGSLFLTGENPKKWKATFDWLIQEDNMVKVLEGNFSVSAEGSIGFDLNKFFEAATHSWQYDQ